LSETGAVDRRESGTPPRSGRDRRRCSVPISSRSHYPSAPMAGRGGIRVGVAIGDRTRQTVAARYPRRPAVFDCSVGGCLESAAISRQDIAGRLMRRLPNFCPRLLAYRFWLVRRYPVYSVVISSAKKSTSIPFFTRISFFHCEKRPSAFKTRGIIKYERLSQHAVQS